MQLTLLGDAAATAVTHAAQHEGAQAVAGALQRAGLAPGEAVALVLPTGTAFFEVFAAIWLAGGVSVPIYPPFRAAQLEDHLRRQAGILDSAQAVPPTRHDTDEATRLLQLILWLNGNRPYMTFGFIRAHALSPHHALGLTEERVTELLSVSKDAGILIESHMPADDERSLRILQLAIAAVRERRTRAVPGGTVGGRIGNAR